MAVIELDEKDKALLSLLDANSRATLAQAAQATGLTKSAVANRIASLEERNIVQGNYAVIDSTRLGYSSMRCYLKFRGTSPAKEKEILAFLQSDSRVWYLGKILGEWDAGLVAWTRNLREFNDFWKAFEKRFKKHIGKSLVSPYLKARHYAPSLAGEAPTLVGIIGEGEQTEIDEADRAVLKQISANSKQTLVEIARKASLTPTIVKYRLKQLAKSKVIQSYRAKINWPLLGYSLYKIDFSLNSIAKAEEIRKFTETIPSLAFIDETLGGADFEAEFYLKDEYELEQLVAGCKKKFFSSIEEINYLVYSNVLKYSYFPE